MKYDYPTSISEAAEILDQHDSKWYRKINLEKLNFESWCDCILGQLFNTYAAGMDTLFIGRLNGDQHDGIFGMEADRKTWVEEIHRRKGNKLTFLEALEEIYKGNQVRCINTRIIFSKGKTGELMIDGEPCKFPFDFWYVEFELVKPLTFAELKVGEKFRYASEKQVHTKCTEAYRTNAVTDDFRLTFVSDSSLVEKV